MKCVQLLEELQGDILACVGLCEHRCSRLNKNIVTGECRGFLGDVYILQAAVGSLEVLVVGLKHFIGDMQALELGAVLGAGCCCGLQKVDEVRGVEVIEVITLVEEVTTASDSYVNLGPVSVLYWVLVTLANGSCCNE